MPVAFSPRDGSGRCAMRVRGSEHRAFDPLMSGRRRHQRFSTGGSYEGALRVRREVAVDGPDDDGTLAVTSDAPGVPNEILTLDLVANRTATSLTVQVIESRPVMVEGAMRHTLRLAVIDGWQRDVR